MAPVILYTTNGSPPCVAVLAVAEALGLKIEERTLDLKKGEHLKPEFLKLNPQHTVPTMVDDDLVIWDSHAISTYLVSKYGKTDSLYPKDLKKRAVIDQRLHFCSSIFYAIFRSIVHQVLTYKKDVINRDDINGVLNGYKFLEEFLGDNKWVAGNEMTVADISIATILNNLSLGILIDETKYPHLTAWQKRYKALPICRELAPGTLELGQKIKQIVDKSLG